MYSFLHSKCAFNYTTHYWTHKIIKYILLLYLISNEVTIEILNDN